MYSAFKDSTALGAELILNERQTKIDVKRWTFYDWERCGDTGHFILLLAIYVVRDCNSLIVTVESYDLKKHVLY
nr:unnamed protein product [Callosobruchus chinensis]